MPRPKTVLLAVLTVLLAVLAFRFIRSGGREDIRPAEDVGAPASGLSEAEARNLPRRTVTVFFARENDDRLVGEKREIPADGVPDREARAILDELLRGSLEGNLSPLPPGTKLEQVFVAKNGTAYVDFSRDLVARHPSGTSAETATIFAVVNSLTANLASVKNVLILVDGEERETLSGHLRLNRPLLPNMGLIAKN
ncbi:MAG: GerMN domain-containing protein [Candidatus Aminicenantes bacterium]|nr:GerMN domain-containing protein [Candidatus Aminicenantes bacterium]